MNTSATWSLQVVIDQAQQEAIRLSHPYIRAEHLMLALLKQESADLVEACLRTAISREQWIAQIEALPSPQCGAEAQLTLSAIANIVINEVLLHHQPQSRHLAEALVNHSPILRRLLQQQGVTIDLFLENLR